MAGFSAIMRSADWALAALARIALMPAAANRRGNSL
jgi:hypothetical protein